MNSLSQWKRWWASKEALQNGKYQQYTLRSYCRFLRVLSSCWFLFGGRLFLIICLFSLPGFLVHLLIVYYSCDSSAHHSVPLSTEISQQLQYFSALKCCKHNALGANLCSDDLKISSYSSEANENFCSFFPFFLLFLFSPFFLFFSFLFLLFFF